MSFLVLGNYRASLAVLRSLAASGRRVIVGDGGDGIFARRSRHCDAVWEHPSFLRHPAEFVNAVIEFLERRTDVNVVFPVSHAAVVRLARGRGTLPSRVTVVSPPPGQVETCIDKKRMFEIAAQAGVPHEPFARVTGSDELKRAVGEIGYPAIVRPVGSGPARLPGRVKARIVPDPETLDRHLGVWPDGHEALLVQRFAPGPRHNVYFAARQGRILASVEVRQLRTDRADGTGYAVEGVTVDPSDDITDYCRRLVERIGYTGVGCAQFLRPDGRSSHFLELNPRLGANFAVVDRCGLDLTDLACELAAGLDPTDRLGDFRYPAGVRYAWTLGDLRGLRWEYGGGRIGASGAVRWFLRTLRAAAVADAHLTWSIRDPLPTLAMYGHWMPGLGRWRRQSRR